MNYIWELAVKAKQQNINFNEIEFHCGEPFSAYMELSFENINEAKVLRNVEINPFFRYYSVFKELLEPNVEENREIIAAVHDLTVHHLTDIDLLMGMSRREYYISFVINDMKDGFWGEYVQEKIHIFNRLDQKIIANNILYLHMTGECIHLLKDTLSRVFTNSYIFSNAVEKDEIILYLRTNETKEKREKIEVIKHLFLPFKCNVEIYWENIFGIVGVDELMKMESIMNY